MIYWYNCGTITSSSTGPEPRADMLFPRIVRRLASLSMSELADLFAAQAVLLSARAALRRKPVGQLLRAVEPSVGPAVLDGDARIARMVTAIDRVARYGLFRPTCLVRAIALERIARRTDPRATVRIGVRPNADALLAHAWLECGGRVIGDDPAAVRQFVALHDFSALPE